MTGTQVDRSVSGVLFVSLELGGKSWKVGSACARGERPRVKTIPARDVNALAAELVKAKRRWKLPEDAAVLSCYEAGRDGFWLHRWLVSQGVENVVVDPASLNRRRRRGAPKSDRLDTEALLKLRMDHASGDPACRTVRVPSPEVEAQRHVTRELVTLKAERTAHTNRIKSLLVLRGIPSPPIGKRFLAKLATLRQHDGSELPDPVQNQIRREYERLMMVQSQIKVVEAQRRRILKEESKRGSQARQLYTLKGIGMAGSTTLVDEMFGWREFDNKKQVGAFVGLVPGVNQSGEMTRDTSITRRGNRLLRALMVELAWCWLRFQPDSKLSQWFLKRFAKGGKRYRRIGIVAMARQLLIQLWRYLETGVIPEGAILKTV